MSRGSNDPVDRRHAKRNLKYGRSAFCPTVKCRVAQDKLDGRIGFSGRRIRKELYNRSGVLFHVCGRFFLGLSVPTTLIQSLQFVSPPWAVTVVYPSKLL